MLVTMLSGQSSDLLSCLNRDNVKKRDELNRLQGELAALTQSTVTVVVEPDTTVYNEDSEVVVETDATVKRFRCKQLRAEIDILAQKDLKLLPDDPGVRYTALKSDLTQLTLELRDCLTLHQEQERELHDAIGREKKTSVELEATVSAAEKKLSETGHKQESKKEVHKRLAGRCKKFEAANQNKLKQMTKFIEKYYPLPSAEAYKKVAKKVQGTAGSKLSPHRDLLTLNTIVERLMSASLETPNEPYIEIEDNFWPPYIELLLQCDMAVRHPADSKRIKLMPFHL